MSPPPITLPQAPTVTQTPTPQCGFIDLGSIGCKKNNEMSVIRSAADWADYQAFPSCGTHVPGALDGFNFSQEMVLSYDFSSCVGGGIGSVASFREVCIHPDRIDVIVDLYSGDMLLPPGAPPHCSGSAIAIPQSSLPINLMTCVYAGLPPPGGYPPCP